MRTHQVECGVWTAAVPDFVDITDDVQKTLQDSGIVDGQVTVFALDPACALVANEKESGLLRDIETAMSRLGGSLANGRPTIGSSSLVLPAVGGTLRLGMWQRVLLIELEAPSPRSVLVQIVGE
jgi:thiamine phosphate synthase YjbQ (UPF0047 family)